MYRLLIIDDEPYMVDGMYELLAEIPDLELDVYRAYSPEEAMEWLTRTRMDIVLSDIRMPGMSGLELQLWVLRQWPRCKVIFLTGMTDIQMAQQAIRSGAVNYVLKTEGDEEIVRSIRQAIADLSEEVKGDQLIARAKEQLHQALPLLQREWLLGLLALGNHTHHFKKSRLRELNIGLDPDDLIFPVIGRVDQWRDEDSPADKTLLLYAVQNIVLEYMQTATLFPVLLNDSYMILLVQPVRYQEESAELSWRKAVSFVQGTLENVQQTCKSLLHLSVSFVSWMFAVPWRELPQVYDDMKRTLVLGMGNGREMLLTAQGDFHTGGQAAALSSGSIGHSLENLLESGLQEEFNCTLSRLFSDLSADYLGYVRLYCFVANLFLHQMERWGGASAEHVVNISRLVDVSAHPTKEQALAYLLDTASTLFQLRRELQDARTSHLMMKLQRWIQDNLHSDLSLTVLAEYVHLNPTYLSVLYKQQTGKNISEYITEARIEKAKELLDKSYLKIHEIAEKIGIETAGYFTRFFKKHTAMTPQEYRNR